MTRSWKMLNQIKNFMLDESGLETVEWAIVGGLIVAVTAAVFSTIGTNARGRLLELAGFTAAAS
jgi:Flp pilus assembly pilin Flp